MLHKSGKGNDALVCHRSRTPVYPVPDNPDFPSRVFTPAVLVMVSHALSDRRSHTPVMPGT